MLTNTMKTDPQEARRLMGTVAWNCCAAQTPAGSIYQKIVRHVEDSKRPRQPDSWQAAMRKSSVGLSQAFAKKGLSLTAPLFYFHGTGREMQNGRKWHCGAVSLGIVAAVDLLTRPFGRQAAIHVLAAVLVLSWPLREGMRFVGIAGVLALGASGGLLGVAVGTIKHIKIRAAGAIKEEDMLQAAKLAWSELLSTLSVLTKIQSRAVELLEDKIERRLSSDEIALTNEVVKSWVGKSLVQARAEAMEQIARQRRREEAEDRALPPGEDPVFGPIIRF